MKINFLTSKHLLAGSYRDLLQTRPEWFLDEWLHDLRPFTTKWNFPLEMQNALSDFEVASYVYMKELEKIMPVRKNRTAARNKVKLVLPTGRSTPETSPWQYAYHVAGERKIGKTTFSIQGCEELVIQFDKSQLNYSIRELVPVCWSDRTGRKLGVEQIVRALEEKAESDEEFPYERIVFDGVAEAYQMVTQWACKKRGVEHPGDDEVWGRTWTLIRETFTDVVNRLIRLQTTARCGLFFISHTEWRERQSRGSKQKIMRLESDLPGRCEKIINGKVDGWFVYDYDGSDRVLHLLGSQEIGAGHRMDGHFRTPAGERIREIYFGDDDTDAKFSLDQFMKAFNNEYPFKTVKDFRAGKSPSPARKKRKRRRAQ